MVICERRDGFLRRSCVVVEGGVLAAARLESPAGDGSLTADYSTSAAGGGDATSGSGVLEGSGGVDRARNHAPAHNHGVIGFHGHPPVAMVMALAPPEGWFVLSLIARAAASSALDERYGGHDTTSHVWRDHGTYLSPFMR